MTSIVVRLRNYIGGHWVDGEGDWFSSVNPTVRTSELGRGNAASSEQVKAAILAASGAYDNWRNMPRPKKEEYFYRLLLKFGDPEDPSNVRINALARLITNECGKTLNEARADVVEGIHMIRLCAGMGRRPIGDVIPSEFPEKLIYTERDPRGVTAVISPWNFPFAIPWWMMGPALMMGNTVVLKPAEQTAVVGQKIVEMCEEVGFPAGVVNLVHGMAETGKTLVSDERVRLVLFTGSYEVGRSIKQVCAEDSELDKMVVAETGSKSALIVLPDADLLLAAEATSKSAFKTTGQRCVSAGRVFVPERLLSHFCDLVMDWVAQNVRTGNPLNESTFMGPLIDKEGAEKVLRYNDMVREADSIGERNVSILMEAKADMAKGNFVTPFIYLAKNDPTFAPLVDEVFGPHLAIIPVKDVDEAVRAYESAPYSLSLSIITKGMGWRDVARRIRHKGMIYVNLPTIGAEVQAPFGGTRRSGTGMPSAADMFNHVSHPVAYTVNTSDSINLAQGLK
ncbi:MAG: hypothetical protein A2827_02960 [Candidatus Spechtbacteria bacterium RIFCSPHIGHO2_01_FULL_43_30]|uniref:Aldehyde dehydrogenase domain-containing protein n=1 Tax=Candidatus Spechtbacteria bacterium RIFCSPHIGHO2_01_FULL_43_30 TaxID=1802158 RepID=A0A1G2H898_9BACT|nr:MAG: hypothetical protein A2827_02960 [Candidatus Spechtbacteria bacterium RIFCSPHIGHO2_01_FULL_43_30]